MTDTTHLDYISRYSRKQAIADGLLHPLPEPMTREIGFGAPLALTQKLHSALFDWPGRGTRTKECETKEATTRILGLLEGTIRAAVAAGRRALDLLDFEHTLPTPPEAHYGADPKRLRLTLHEEEPGEVVFTLGFVDDEW